MSMNLFQKYNFLLIINLVALLLFLPFSADAQDPTLTSPRKMPYPTQGEVTVINDRGIVEQQRFMRESSDIKAPPAWAQENDFIAPTERIAPFGANLFEGRFTRTYHDELNAGYLIMPGDQVAVKIWGAMTYNEIQVVDQQGNIFIPEIGPIALGGVPHGELSNRVKLTINNVFSNNVEVYTNLMSAQPVAIYVAGFVNSPGRYAGSPTDSILFYLDNAGGIDANLGSYRDIEIVREGKVVAKADLYQFILEGKVPFVRLQDGDTVLVNKRLSSVAASGLVRDSAFYEFTTSDNTGKYLAQMTQPLPGATNVSIIGTRDNHPINIYIPLEEFYDFQLKDNDLIEFRADKQADTIMVSVEGQIETASRMPVKVGTRLRTLLQYVAINPEITNLSGIYIQRRSAAQQQKKAIIESLDRLERSALTATSNSTEEAKLRVQETQLIKQFIANAKNVKPKGVVVVSGDDGVANILLQDGDRIIIPQKNDIILVSGEVLMPRSIVYSKGRSASDYIDQAGGITDKGDEDDIFVVRPNGEVGRLANFAIQPGDQILVMPKHEFKGMQFAKDITQILYQIAIATSTVLNINN